VIDVRVSPSDDLFRVVVVSAADVSRGPAVQRVLRAHLAALGSADRVALTSSGTVAVAGQPLHPHMAQALTEVTPDAGPHRSRPVSERRLAQADLVLTVSRAERRRVGELRPAAADLTFTVVEFARLASGVGEPVDDPRRLVRLLAGLRSEIRPSDPGEDDLDDPASGEYRDHERVVRRVDHAARDIARGLAGRAGAAPGSGRSAILRIDPAPELTSTGFAPSHRVPDSSLTVPDDAAGAVATGPRGGDQDTDDPTFGPYLST
jgi:low molecular weight protein-tyrosine phosphatase